MGKNQTFWPTQYYSLFCKRLEFYIMKILVFFTKKPGLVFYYIMLPSRVLRCSKAKIGVFLEVGLG